MNILPDVFQENGTFTPAVLPESGRIFPGSKTLDKFGEGGRVLREQVPLANTSVA